MNYIERLAWATDIHLDFVSFNRVAEFCHAVSQAACGALVITGDIGESDSVVGYLETLAARINIPIYFVLGNHDFYGGRIAEVRTQISALADAHAGLHYLPDAGIVPLNDAVALIGCDGWGDAQLGRGFHSRVVLQDHYLIRDLAALPVMGRFARLRALGEAEAERVRELLPKSLDENQQVIFATHVPPFREACWHQGKISDDDWLPHFTCKAVGDALLEVMRKYPTRKLTVLCGHTHGAGVTHVLPNLVVYTGGARYGMPALQNTIKI
ncbi:MAG: metallophosphoesterase [Pyrinomonadaceae bacterium MAG19_C2-C3]|nr:metallophosphoesterase [Pyrinomonadaceae bacterium MAG19_C2-C3]